jgi:hypothetical protein
MRYDYKGLWSCDSSCEIEVHRRSDGKSVFLVTVLADISTLCALRKRGLGRPLPVTWRFRKSYESNYQNSFI